MFCSVAILVLFIAQRVSLKRKKIPQVLLAQGREAAGARGGPGSLREQVHHLGLAARGACVGTDEASYPRPPCLRSGVVYDS